MSTSGMRLRSKTGNGNKSDPTQVPPKPSTLTQRTPAYTSARGRGRGGTRGSSTFSKGTLPTNNPPIRTGAIPKTTDASKCPIAEAKQQEAHLVNNLLDSQMNNPQSSMNDLLGNNAPLAPSLEPLGPTLNQQRAQRPPNDPPNPELSLQEELIYCKNKIREMSYQMGLMNLSRQREEYNLPTVKEPHTEIHQEHNLQGSQFRSSNGNGARRVQNQEMLNDSESGSDQEENEEDSEEEVAPPRLRQRQYKKCQMDRWRIKFSGGNGMKFWKKVEKLQRSYDYDDEMVFKYFYLLLDGHALEWYWQYSDQYEVSNLPHLKKEFLRVFKPRESDMELISVMYSRKQGSDSFEKFYNDVVDMNYSLKDPLSDAQLIEILRTNVIDEIRQRIFTFSTRDRVKFFHKANQAYHDVCKVKERRKPFQEYRAPPRRVNELNFEEMSHLEIEEISSKLNNWKAQRAERRCYNCHMAGHFLADCPEEISRFFCFKCGLDGYATPKCPNCSPKGSRSMD